MNTALKELSTIEKLLNSPTVESIKEKTQSPVTKAFENDPMLKAIVNDPAIKAAKGLERFIPKSIADQTRGVSELAFNSNNILKEINSINTVGK